MHQARAWLHYEAAIGVLLHFGHMDSAGKGIPPAVTRDVLSITEDVDAEMLYLTAEKKQAYARDCAAALGSPSQASDDARGVRVAYNELNTLVHKLPHAATL